MKGKMSVTYVALLLTRHAVLRANGAVTESHYPGRQAMRTATIPAPPCIPRRSEFGSRRCCRLSLDDQINKRTAERLTPCRKQRGYDTYAASTHLFRRPVLQSISYDED